MRKRIFKLILSVSIAISITFSGVGFGEVNAAEVKEDINEENIEEITFSQDVDIIEPEPEQLYTLEDNGDVLNESIERTTFDLLNEQSEEINEIAETTGIYDMGRAVSYLTETGDLRYLQLSVDGGKYIQARLYLPSSNDLDYDLYITDANINALAGCEYESYVNGTNGTAMESVGYITEAGEAQDYYIIVVSSNGGSINETFTLEYVISDNYDAYEPSENAYEAKPITFPNAGIDFSQAALSTPVDSDWYYVSIPENRIYDGLYMAAYSESSNSIAMEIYQNISTNNGIKLKRVAGVTDNMLTLPVSTGRYYIKVSNAGSLEEFNKSSITNYTLAIRTRLRPTNISIDEYDGNEGINKFVQYPGYSRKYFRTKGWIKVTGSVYAKDPETGAKYAISGCSVTARYYNPYWAANNTSYNAEKTATGVTGSDGTFSITMQLPPAMGAESYYAPLSTQYYDLCAFDTYVTDYPNIIYEDGIILIDRSDYRG